MKKCIVFILICFLSQAAFAQKDKIKFGKVSKEELLKERSDIDPSAPMELLVKSQKLRRNGDVFFKTKMFRYKFYPVAGIKNPIFSKRFSLNGSESFSRIKVVTMNLVEGKIEKSKLEQKNIFKKWVNSRICNIEFEMPNVREGSIVDIIIETKSSAMNIDFRVDLQDEIPIKYSIYESLSSEKTSFEYDILGSYPIKISSRNDANSSTFNFIITSYVAENLPAFVKEEHIIGANAFRSGLELPASYINRNQESWMEVAKKCDETLTLKDWTAKEKRIIRKWSKAELEGSDLAILTQIFHGMKSEIEVEKLNGGEISFEQIQEKVRINSVLCETLKTRGYDAFSFCSTLRNTIFDGSKVLPGRFLINKLTVVFLNDETLFLDLSTPESVCFQLAPNKLNLMGIVANGNNYELINFNNPNKELLVMNFEGNWNGNLISGDWEIEYADYALLKHNISESKNTSKLHVGYLKPFYDSASTLTTKETLKYGNALKYKYVLKEKEFGSRDKDTLLIPLTSIFEPIKNVFHQNANDRKAPIFMDNASQIRYHAAVTIPKGYFLINPEPITQIKSEGGDIKLRVTKSQNGQKLELSYVYLLKETVFTEQAYGPLKEIHEQIEEMTSMNLKLVKKD